MRVLELILKIFVRGVFLAVCKTGDSSTVKCTSVRHVASVAVDDSESSSLYGFNLVNLCDGKRLVPNKSRIF